MPCPRPYGTGSHGYRFHVLLYERAMKTTIEPWAEVDEDDVHWLAMCRSSVG